MDKKVLFTLKIGDGEIRACESGNSAIDDEIYAEYKSAVLSFFSFYPADVVCERLKNLHISFEIDGQMPDNTALEAAFLDLFEKNPDCAPNSLFRADTTDEYLERWIENLRKTAEETPIDANVTGEWVEFDYGDKFYGRYRKVDKENPILLVSLPCYAADWNSLTPYLHLPCDILQLSPLGYNTPRGYDLSKRGTYGAWPVLFDTVLEVNEDAGYRKWALECVMAINKMRRPNQKIAFLGTSQGGGMSLVMSSVMREITVACAVEMPFLIGFSGKNYNKVKLFVGAQERSKMVTIYDFCAREHLFAVDPMSHAKRLDMPTLIVSGELDDQCPKEDIFEFSEKLSCPKKYVELAGAHHGYTAQFANLAAQWILTNSGK